MRRGPAHGRKTPARAVQFITRPVPFITKLYGAAEAPAYNPRMLNPDQVSA